MVGVRTGDCFPTRAEELFLQAALLPDARAVEAWRTLRPEFDLDRVGGVIHTLVPMLYASLQAHGVDDPVMGRLKGQYRFFWLRNQLQMARGAKAIDALQRHGIPVILLKGAAMAAAYLDDPTVRPMSDIDVLVPTERLHDALLALRQGGWTPHPQMSDRMIAEDIARWSPSWDFRDSTATSVDLHWHVMHLSMQPDADADFWAASQETGFGGRCVRTLCAADHVLHSLSHGMSWQEGAIRWVPDSLMVLRKAGETFDWLRLIEQAEKRRLIEFVRAGIDYLHREFAAPVPDDVLNRMRRIRTPWLDRIEFRARARRTSDGDWTARVAQAVAAARRRRPLGALPSLRADLRRLGSAFGLPDDARVSTVLTGLVAGRSWRLRKWLRRLHRGGAMRAAEARQAPIVGLGDSIYLARHTLGSMYEMLGWHYAEPNGRWSNGNQAVLTVLWRDPDALPRTLELEAWPLLGHGREDAEIDVIVNGTSVGRHRVRIGENLQRPWRVDLAAADLRGSGPIEIVLRVDRAVRPCDVSGTGDARLLGCFVHRVALLGTTGRAPSRSSANSRRLGLVDLATRDLPPLELKPGGEFTFGMFGGIESVPGAGWHGREPQARWSNQPMAEVRFKWAGPLGAPIPLELVGHPLMFGARNVADVTLLANGRRFAERRFGAREHSMTRWRVEVPADAVGSDRALDLLIAVRDPTSPAALGMSHDDRILGYFLHGIASPVGSRA